MLRGNPGARGVIDRQLDIQTDNIYRYGVGLANANGLFSRTQEEAQVWNTKPTVESAAVCFFFKKCSSCHSILKRPGCVESRC